LLILFLRCSLILASPPGETRLTKRRASTDGAIPTVQILRPMTSMRYMGCTKPSNEFVFSFDDNTSLFSDGSTLNTIGLKKTWTVTPVTSPKNRPPRRADSAESSSSGDTVSANSSDDGSDGSVPRPDRQGSSTDLSNDSDVLSAEAALQQSELVDHAGLHAQHLDKMDDEHEYAKAEARDDTESSLQEAAERRNGATTAEEALLTSITYCSAEAELLNLSQFEADIIFTQSYHSARVDVINVKINQLEMAEETADIEITLQQRCPCCAMDMAPEQTKCPFCDLAREVASADSYCSCDESLNLAPDSKRGNETKAPKEVITTNTSRIKLPREQPSKQRKLPRVITADTSQIDLPPKSKSEVVKAYVVQALMQQNFEKEEHAHKDKAELERSFKAEKASCIVKDLIHHNHSQEKRKDWIKCEDTSQVKLHSKSTEAVKEHIVKALMQQNSMKARAHQDKAELKRIFKAETNMEGDQQDNVIYSELMRRHVSKEAVHQVREIVGELGSFRGAKEVAEQDKVMYSELIECNVSKKTVYQLVALNYAKDSLKAGAKRAKEAKADDAVGQKVELTQPRYTPIHCSTVDPPTQGEDGAPSKLDKPVVKSLPVSTIDPPVSQDPISNAEDLMALKSCRAPVPQSGSNKQPNPGEPFTDKGTVRTQLRQIHSHCAPSKLDKPVVKSLPVSTVDPPVSQDPISNAEDLMALKSRRAPVPQSGSDKQPNPGEPFTHKGTVRTQLRQIHSQFTKQSAPVRTTNMRRHQKVRHGLATISEGSTYSPRGQRGGLSMEAKERHRRYKNLMKENLVCAE